MTNLGALEYTVPDLTTRSALVIHIVGAADDELSVMELNEDLLHYCPNLEELSIAYVNPHVPKNSTEKRKLCDECHKNGRSLTVAYFQALYHNSALVKNKSENVADLICAFNRGHTVGNPAVGVAPTTWTLTLKHIFASNTPAVLTTYIVMEASKEEGAMDRLGANFVLRPQINPWQSLVGYPLVVNPKGTMRYKNYYWYIVKGFKEGFQPAAAEDESKMLKAILDKHAEDRLRLAQSTSCRLCKRMRVVARRLRINGSGNVQKLFLD
ncbi:MAG: hypothetical protein L6R38_001850 [Xanthoria sp. 2 TBL-2021]|nr:MAG: hypothetical protein L6R38_001850 [Xanthoria sp. 2 TBL-2021]